MASSPENSSSLLVLPKPNSSGGRHDQRNIGHDAAGESALQRMPSSMYMNAVFFVAASTAPLLAQ